MSALAALCNEFYINEEGEADPALQGNNSCLTQRHRILGWTKLALWRDCTEWGGASLVLKKLQILQEKITDS